MPGGDKTGPQGAGPMTGRQMGFCVGENQAGGNYPRTFGGRGFGRGRGMGWGNRSRFGRFEEEVINDASPDASKVESLEKEIIALKEQLASFGKQLSKFTKGD